MAGRLSGRIATSSYLGGAGVRVGTVALSELEGTLMTAAPSSAAAAVTARRAVFKFTANLQSLERFARAYATA